MDNLNNIVLDGENIDISSLSMEKLKEILNKINEHEIMIKQELDAMIKRLA